MSTSFYNAKYLRTQNVKLSFCTLTLTEYIVMEKRLLNSLMLLNEVLLNSPMF